MSTPSESRFYIIVESDHLLFVRPEQGIVDKVSKDDLAYLALAMDGELRSGSNVASELQNQPELLALAASFVSGASPDDQTLDGLRSLMDAASSSDVCLAFKSDEPTGGCIVTRRTR